MNQKRNPRTSGFTLVEVTIATLLFALVIGSVYSIYVRGERSQQVGLELAEATQNARSGVDLIAREIRSAGYGVDPTTQPALVTASQYRVTFALDFNGNKKIDMGEVITYFLDPDPGNPLVLGGNPQDFVLRRKAGVSGDSLATPVPGQGEIVAYGLTQRTADNVATKNVPLFSYVDAAGTALELKTGTPNDPAGVFWGRTVTDADLGKPPAPGVTSKVKSVIVSMVTETKQKNLQTGSYDRVTVSTAVEPRNFPFLAQNAAQYATTNTGATGTGTGTGSGTGSGTGTGSDTGTGTGTGTGSGTGLPPSQPPIHIPTDRVLSLVLFDLNENDSNEGSNTTVNGQHDLDIVVGTKASGVANIRAWWNGQPGRYDGNVYYQSTQNWLGAASYDIPALAAANVDSSNENAKDLVTGVVTGVNTGLFQIWRNQAFGNLGEVPGKAGAVGDPTTPSSAYGDAPGTGEVQAVAVADMNMDGYRDVLLGTKTGSNQGKVEVWFGDGLGAFLHEPDKDVYSASGEVRGVAAADMNQDGWPDIVAGTKTNTMDTQGNIDIFFSNGPGATLMMIIQGNATVHPRFTTIYSVAAAGAVYAIGVGKMDSDDLRDVVTAVRTGSTAGMVEFWKNNGTFSNALSRRDMAATAGPAISLALGPVDYGNTSNDIVVGTSGAGGGIPPAVQAFFCNPDASNGAIIPDVQSWADANAGGSVNAVGIGRLECSQDYLDNDPLPDIVAGTATSASTGDLVIYLNPYASTVYP